MTKTLLNEGVIANDLGCQNEIVGSDMNVPSAGVPHNQYLGLHFQPINLLFHPKPHQHNNDIKYFP